MKKTTKKKTAKKVIAKNKRSLNEKSLSQLIAELNIEKRLQAIEKEFEGLYHALPHHSALRTLIGHYLAFVHSFLAEDIDITKVKKNTKKWEQIQFDPRLYYQAPADFFEKLLARIQTVEYPDEIDQYLTGSLIQLHELNEYFKVYLRRVPMNTPLWMAIEKDLEEISTILSAEKAAKATQWRIILKDPEEHIDLLSHAVEVFKPLLKKLEGEHGPLTPEEENLINQSVTHLKADLTQKAKEAAAVPGKLRRETDKLRH